MDNYISQYYKLLKDEYKNLRNMKNICPCRIRNKEQYKKDIVKSYNDIWKIIHEFALDLPIDYEKLNRMHKEKVKIFYTEKVSKIPCITCNTHYIEYVTNNNLDNIKNSLELIEWTFELHNDVNKKTNKKILSIDDILEIYKK